MKKVIFIILLPIVGIAQQNTPQNGQKKTQTSFKIGNCRPELVTDSTRYANLAIIKLSQFMKGAYVRESGYGDSITISKITLLYVKDNMKEAIDTTGAILSDRMMSAIKTEEPLTNAPLERGVKLMIDYTVGGKRTYTNSIFVILAN